MDSGLDHISGANILLFTEGGDIVGRADGTEVFRFSVDSATGEVTVSQSSAIKHDDPNDPQEQSVAEGTVAQQISAGLIELTMSITDADNDPDSDNIEVGSLVNFLDDGPTASTADVSADMLVVDESPVPEDGDGIASVTASFADNFAAADFGTDGAGGVDYALVLTGSNVGSGLYTLGVDGAQGDEILLSQSGDAITGSVGDTDYFTISVDSDTGVVTFTQLENVWHSNTGDDDDTSTLNVDEGEGQVPNSLKITQTVTDADGDTDSAAIDLGDGVFKIEDDGPTVSIGDTFVYNADGSSNTGTQSFDFGTDGQVSTGALLLTATAGLPAGFNLVQMPDPNTWRAVLGTEAADSDPTTDLFVVVMDPSQGTYTFTLLNEEPPVPVQVDIDSGVSTGTWRDINGNVITSGDVYSSVIEPSGNNIFRITASGTDNDGAAEISVKNATIGVGGDDDLQSQFGDVFHLSFENTTGQKATFTTISMTLQHFDHDKEDFEITVTGTNAIGNPLSATYSVGDPGVTIGGADPLFSDSNIVTIDVSGFGSISQISTANIDGVFKVVDFDVNFTVSQNVGDYSYDFLATATDGDLDTAQAAFTVTVLAGTAGNDNLTTGSFDDTVSGGAGNDTISTGAGNDILIGGDGSDVLTGGAGGDTFKWNATDGDTANVPVDEATDFDTVAGALGGDKLDLSELLQSPDGFVGVDLTAYLKVTSNGTTTVIKVMSDGGELDQTIEVNGDLTGGLNQVTHQAEIIQSLLDQTKLISE